MATIIPDSVDDLEIRVALVRSKLRAAHDAMKEAEAEVRDASRALQAAEATSARACHTWGSLLEAEADLNRALLHALHLRALGEPRGDA